MKIKIKSWLQKWISYLSIYIVVFSVSLEKLRQTECNRMWPRNTVISVIFFIYKIFIDRKIILFYLFLSLHFKESKHNQTIIFFTCQNPEFIDRKRNHTNRRYFLISIKKVRFFHQIFPSLNTCFIVSEEIFVTMTCCCSSCSVQFLRGSIFKIEMDTRKNKGKNRKRFDSGYNSFSCTASVRITRLCKSWKLSQVFRMICQLIKWHPRAPRVT